MKKALATINTDIGIMTIYYNGAGEYLTAELGSTVETIEDGKPESIEEAANLIGTLYVHAVWELTWLED